jgi:hypothetical protein
MMKHGKAWEKLHLAVHTLATSTEGLQDRLASAWVHSGSLLALGAPSGLPAELQVEYDAINDALTKVHDPAQGGINATCATMSDEDARRLAERIVNLYDSVCRAHYRAGG